MSEFHPHTNRLIHEKSPYLLQHAHNPVDWYPWSQEAFDTAVEKDKPIFLSIGYATCHWCHVMENESFESEEIAKMMNDLFVNIKVDREEMPEVDNLYMEFAQSMMSGAAGWPLTVLLTPSLEPFFAATYLPPKSVEGMIGMADLVERIQEMWLGEEREKVVEQAQKIVEVFRENAHSKGSDLPERLRVEDAAELFFKLADSTYGGMKGTPKFPIGYLLNMMLRYSKQMQDSRALFLVEKSLDMMQRGGIWDHLGGGFSRYSVDEEWLVPHFEKMLYDNSVLIYSYLEAWQATQKDFYRQTCEKIISYIFTDMTDSSGGFYSAEDADSEGEEGLFYTWKYEKIVSILGEQDSTLFCDFFGVTEEGNFEGRNILNTPLRGDEFAAQNGLDQQEFEELIEAQKQLLLAVRKKRVRPAKDDKVITSWNGLMIHALAEASSAFSKPEYMDAALKAAKFIKANMWIEGRLYRRWREGETMYPATLDDYASLIRGVLTLFENGAGTEWLEWAMTMCDILRSNFKEQDGAFYQTEGIDPNIILRKCQFSDGAEPCGNSLQCENLLRLHQMTNNPHYLSQAEDILKAIKPLLDSYPPGYSFQVMNLLRYYDDQAPTIVVALNKDLQFKKELQHFIASNFIPHKFVIWRHPEDEKLLKYVPFANEEVPLNGKTTLYICRQGSCDKPITDISEMTEAISKL